MPIAVVAKAEAAGHENISITTVIKESIESGGKEDQKPQKLPRQPTSKEKGDQLPLLFRTSPTAEKVKYALSLVIIALAGPYVAVQIAMCTLWDFIDKKTVNMVELCKSLCVKTDRYFKQFCKNQKDGFMVNEAIILAIILPTYFFYELYLATTVGISYPRIFVYNLVRIGPMYMNFMYVYVMCHKEAHTRGQLWNKRYSFLQLKPIRYVFNFWVGCFHGVVPGMLCWVLKEKWLRLYNI